MTRRLLGAGVAASLLSLGFSAVAGAQSPVADLPVHFTSTYGGEGTRARGHYDDMCLRNHIQPGSHKEARVYLERGHWTLGTTWPVSGTLYCAPVRDVWAGTTGPGHALSIGCPSHERPISGGAGYHTWSARAHLTQSSGSHGRGDDGYWDYRFHDWSTQGVSIQFWAVCVNRDANLG